MATRIMMLFCFLVGVHVVFFQASSVSHHPQPHIHGWNHFQRETRFQFETQASNLTVASCVRTNALIAEFWDHFDHELNSFCIWSHCNLHRQRFQRNFWINFQDCFHIRNGLDECCTHRCEMRIFIWFRRYCFAQRVLGCHKSQPRSQVSVWAFGANGKNPSQSHESWCSLPVVANEVLHDFPWWHTMHTMIWHGKCDFVRRRFIWSSRHTEFSLSSCVGKLFGTVYKFMLHRVSHLSLRAPLRQTLSTGSACLLDWCRSRVFPRQAGPNCLVHCQFAARASRSSGKF